MSHYASSVNNKHLVSQWNFNTHEPKTYISKRVLVRTRVSYKALGFSYAVAVVLVCSDMVAGIKLLGTW